MKNNKVDNICGLFDTDREALYLDSGKVISFKGHRLAEFCGTQMVHAKINRWARYRGHIKSGEVIAVL